MRFALLTHILRALAAALGELADEVFVTLADDVGLDVVESEAFGEDQRAGVVLDYLGTSLAPRTEQAASQIQDSRDLASEFFGVTGLEKTLARQSRWASN